MSEPKPTYHLLPADDNDHDDHDARPSLDSTTSDSQPLIHASPTPSTHSHPLPLTTRTGTTSSSIPLTLPPRLLALIFHLTSLILFALPNTPAPEKIAPLIFLAAALARNLYVLGKHFLVPQGLHVRIVWRAAGRADVDAQRLSAAWRVSGWTVDAALVIALGVCLPVELASARGMWWGNGEGLRRACIVGLVGFGFYVLAALDGGKPGRWTVGLGGCAVPVFKIERTAGRDVDVDVEARLPMAEEEEQETRRQEEGVILL